MDRQASFEQMKAVIVDQMGIDADAITETALFTDDLGLDSLDLLELMTAMEDEFGVTIPDEDFEKLNCLGDVLDELEQLQ